MEHKPDLSQLSETERQKLEELREEMLEADREAAPAFGLACLEDNLATAGQIDLDAGEYLVDLETNSDGAPIAVIAKNV